MPRAKESGLWKWLWPSVPLGLYISRLIAESLVVPWRLRTTVLLALGCIALCLMLFTLLKRCKLRVWPLALLSIYVLWPWAAPAFALALLLVVICISWAINAQPRPGSFWPEVLVSLASLILYIGTLAPTVLPADSGEFQLVSYVLGIAHPPGYPLYTLLGKLFTLLPFGDVAYRLNLFAAVCGAATLGIIARTVRQSTGSWEAALVAAATLGLSTTFWAQSTTANIRSLSALLTALCLASLLGWGSQYPRCKVFSRENLRESQIQLGIHIQSSSRNRMGNQNALLAFGAFFGLAVGHHSSLSLLGLPFLLYILICDPHLPFRTRQWLPVLGVFLASLLVLLYLPLRSFMGAPFDPAPIRSWNSFISHVLALGFRGDMFYYRSLPELLARFRVWLNIMRLEFGGALSWAALGAALLLGIRRWHVLLLLGGAWVINVLSVITYRAPQTVEYLMPSYVAQAVVLGYGLGIVLRSGLRRSLAGALMGLLLWIAVLNGTANYPSFRLLHHDTSARDYAQTILREAPQGALVLSNWHRATPFWYLQQVEKLRSDVEVRYVYPQGTQPNEEVWLQYIAEALPSRPVIVTNRFYAFTQTHYRWIPFHGAWLVHASPLYAPPAHIETKETSFEEGIRVLGYQIDDSDLAPGETLTVRIYWQPTKRLERDYSSFVHLVGPQGVVGQGDIVHHAREYLPGEIRVDSYAFPLLLHTPPGEYKLICGFYYDTGSGLQRLQTQGTDHFPLANIHVHLGQESATTLHPLNERFANGLVLTGVDYDRSVPGQLRLYLHWRHADQPFLARLNYQNTAVHLARQNVPVAQAEIPALKPGCTATIVLDIPDGEGHITLSLSDIEGRPIPALGPWHLPTQREVRLRPPRGKVRYIPLGGDIAFVGFKRVPESTAKGQELWLHPRFLALRPLVADYSISIGLKRREPYWEKKTDSTPALGAIPTLKWVQGWLVEDAHLLTIPEDAPLGQATVTLEVYDAFTLEPLRILDERLVALGQGTKLEVEATNIDR